MHKLIVIYSPSYLSKIDIFRLRTIARTNYLIDCKDRKSILNRIYSLDYYQSNVDSSELLHYQNLLNEDQPEDYYCFNIFESINKRPKTIFINC